jgi:hypothetical protein
MNPDVAFAPSGLQALVFERLRNDHLKVGVSQSINIFALINHRTAPVAALDRGEVVRISALRLQASSGCAAISSRKRGGLRARRRNPSIYMS